MDEFRMVHLRAMDLCDEGDRLRRRGREAEACVAFRRACALEARAARSQGTAYSAARVWCSAGWCALGGGYVGAALRCAENGLKALEGVEVGRARDSAAAGLRDLCDAIAAA